MQTKGLLLYKKCLPSSGRVKVEEKVGDDGVDKRVRSFSRHEDSASDSEGRPESV